MGGVCVWVGKLNLYFDLRLRTRTWEFARGVHVPNDIMLPAKTRCLGSVLKVCRWDVWVCKPNLANCFGCVPLFAGTIGIDWKAWSWHKVQVQRRSLGPKHLTKFGVHTTHTPPTTTQTFKTLPRHWNWNSEFALTIFTNVHYHILPYIKSGYSITKVVIN